MLALPPPNLLSTRIPFGGFYGSLWSDLLDREEEQLAEHMLEEPDLYSPAVVAAVHHDGSIFIYASDYSAGLHLLARRYAEGFANWLADSLDLPDVASTFEEMTSPRFYNFETDRIFIGLSEATFALILERTDPDTLRSTFREMFTSRDGFISSYSSAVPDKPLDEWDHNELYALLLAYWDTRTEGEAVDWLLYSEEWVSDEDIHEAHDASLDWTKLEALAAEWWVENNPDVPEEERPYRCPLTLTLL